MVGVHVDVVVGGGGSAVVDGDGFDGVVRGVDLRCDNAVVVLGGGGAVVDVEVVFV